MKWFASVGNQSKWTKHKFDPYVCSDINTSNFVESFNSTLGVDRCRPVLTLLKVKKYKETYVNNIAPIVDKDLWPTFEDLPNVLPPPLKRGVGRPSRNRRREEGEAPTSKRSKTIKCKNCGHFGHNSRTCKGAPTQRELALSEPVVTKNKKKSSTTKKESSKKAKQGETQQQGVLSQTGSQPPIAN
ncbi:Protein FAM90A27P [Bienertia sinuspersici]